MPLSSAGIVLAVERVPFGTYLAGFEEARDRFHRKMAEEKKETAFKPLFEALNWATTIDDRLDLAWQGSPRALGVFWSEHYQYGETVRGVRFVRNRVHHAWADALHLSRSGSKVEVDHDPKFFTWRWRLARDLPGGKRSEKRGGHRQAYEGHVQSQRVTDTLRELSVCFTSAAADLRPA